jgi:LysM repeat protein
VNSLKPLLIVAVLAGIGYGVYVRINGGNNAPPPDIAPGWDSAPTVQMPDTGSSTPAPWGRTASPTSPGGPAPGIPAMPSGGEAPAYAPPSSSNSAPGYPPNSNAPYTNSGPNGASPQSAPDVSPPYPYANVAEPQNNAAPPVVMNNAPQDSSAGYAADPGGGYRAADTGAAPIADAGGGFAACMDAARRELESGQLASALRQLSAWHEDPRLTPGEQQQLTHLLDQVAGTVVYSTQHLLEPPYEVQPGERLEDIAQRYNVPWQLLAKINGIDDPQTLRPGERLKVVRGPFKAIISLEKRELTVLLADGSYAGRFPIGIGREHPPMEGTYAVSDKVVNPVYHGRDRAIGADDQNNPLGERWIGLGSEMGIHGTNRPDNIGRTDLAGSISLNPRDVEDVYDILTVGSKVTIRR